ncbi:integrase [Aeromonas phage ST4]|nr:integrase [Aeromonas phage ST4]
MPKLTKTLVDSCKPSDTDQWIWDSELPGFGIRIQVSGRKTYVARYRTHDRVQRKLTLARCSDMPPDRARDLARKAFATVAEGGDPTKARRVEKDAPTIADLQDRYMNEHAKPFKKATSTRLDDANWRNHILPQLGKKKVKDLKRSDILSLHGSLSEKPATANQVLALLSKALNLCETWEWRPRNSNPCHEVKKYKIRERELILTPVQIKTLNSTLDELLSAGEIREPMVNLVRLLMLTGCRLREIMHAQRDWVDHERQLLLLPDSKVGQRKIALSGPAMDIISGIATSETWLIPGRYHGQPMDTPYKAWARIKERAGLPTELRIHDLRHTAGSLGHMAGLSQKQIQIMLGHKQMSTTERYLHGATGDDAVIAAKLGSVITGALNQSAAA